MSASGVIRTSGISAPKTVGDNEGSIVLPGSALSSGDKIGIHAWRLASAKIRQPAHPLIIATGLDRTPSNAGNRPVRREHPLRDLRKRSGVTFARFSSTRL